MKRKRLARMLAELLDGDGRKQRIHRYELKRLLKKLTKREIALEQKMHQEQDERKRNRLSKEIDIVNAQYAKGVETLKGLEES